MDIKLDLTKSYGIVLEGGGAKGAYQIGAWKALEEAGVKIQGISGVSVGALNGALMCMREVQKAEQIWSQINFSRVVTLEDGFSQQMKRMVKDWGFDITPLKELIRESIDEQAIMDSDRELFVTTFSISDRDLLTIDLKEVPAGQMEDFLLASAYFLTFKNEKLHGKRYIDGGGFNNVPIQILLDRGYQDIIVIRIYGLGFDSEKKLKTPENVNLYHIAPRMSLGGMLQFEAKRARKNMKLGYFDAKRMLYGLEGKVYYIDAPEDETFYFKKLMRQMEWLEPLLTDKQATLQEYGFRYYTEVLFPMLAKKYLLKADWNYKVLFLTILENLAKKLKINRYQIYQEEEFCDYVRQRIKLLDSSDMV